MILLHSYRRLNFIMVALINYVGIRVTLSYDCLIIINMWRQVDE